MISLDTETTGLDVYHGAKPFFVTVCAESGEQNYWEWDVNPETREPVILDGDIEEIQRAIVLACLPTTPNPGIVCQNGKFDIAALNTIGISSDDWPWEHTHDTLLASHVLASNQPHDLTSLALHYLGIDIQPLEQALRTAILECRRLAKSHRPTWKLAKAGLPDMPSAKEQTWKFDSWLPMAIQKSLGIDSTGGYESVLREYSNADSAVTIALWKGRGQWIGFEEELKRQGLWEIYLEQRKLLPIIYKMESRGVTISKTRTENLLEDYKIESELCKLSCLDMAEDQGFQLEMPKGASPNDSLRTFMFDVLKVPPIRGAKNKTNAPTLNKEAMGHYLATLPQGPALDFVKALLGKRKLDTSIAYLEGYRRYWKPACEGYSSSEWYVLHASYNPTGTSTLRFSSSDPNIQNVSKSKDEGGLTLRYCIGPGPDEELWTLDGQNLELRIPAYKSPEPEMIALFEKPNEPPYYGSNHLLNFHTVYPDLWEEAIAIHGPEKVGEWIKSSEGYKSTWYQWCKNGGFAVQYGGQDETADRAFHRKGSRRKLVSRFKCLMGPGGLNERCIKQAEKYGYIETIPDRSLPGYIEGKTRGYPLWCTRTEYGKILPTIPLSYYVQGSAMWWMRKAMVRCQAQLDEWNHPLIGGRLYVPRYFIAFQVHDELGFIMPKGRGKEPWKTNLPRVRKLQALMEEGGRDIGVPTPISVTYHPETWASGIDINLG